MRTIINDEGVDEIVQSPATKECQFCWYWRSYDEPPGTTQAQVNEKMKKRNVQTSFGRAR